MIDLPIDNPTLTSVEKNGLAEREATIEQGLSTFIAVGKALAEINSQRLYRETHDNFADYVNERWGRSRRWAEQLIQSAKAAETCTRTKKRTNGSHSELAPPKNERIARSVATAPEELQPAVWAEAVERHDGDPTQSQVAEIVAEMVPKKPKKAASGEAISTKNARAALGKLTRELDAIGVFADAEDAIEIIHGVLEKKDGRQ